MEADNLIEEGQRDDSDHRSSSESDSDGAGDMWTTRSG